MNRKNIPKRINFMNTIQQVKNKATTEAQFTEYDCDCGKSFAVETKTSIWVACRACRKKVNHNPKFNRNI
jgi:ribosomal protein L37AE/L43A